MGFGGGPAAGDVLEGTEIVFVEREVGGCADGGVGGAAGFF